MRSGIRKLLAGLAVATAAVTGAGVAVAQSDLPPPTPAQEAPPSPDQTSKHRDCPCGEAGESGVSRV